MTSRKDWIEDPKQDDYDFIVEQCARYHLDEIESLSFDSDASDDSTTKE